MTRLSILTFILLIAIAALIVDSQQGRERNWFVSQADLNVELRAVTENEGDHTIEIIRQYEGDKEATILKKAEAVYPNKISRYDPQLKRGGTPSENEPLWWETEFDNVRVAYAVTAKAVRYYYDTSQGLRSDPKFISGYQMYQTKLKYTGTVKHYDEYAHAKDTFTDVYVAVLELDWSQTCGGLCGMFLKRKKEVVLDSKANVLALYMDAPENNQITVS